ncbi:hypothetical protein F4808DRAFT_366227 [Astrocystis sublimbata]|nr:hypothetical protein F4808DRAFT_365823 [Astrocystis sublimbata]KAI0204010.1 hypothetical protein F4808DRAFT_366227 [Astrocystis sublimbata]
MYQAREQLHVRRVHVSQDELRSGQLSPHLQDSLTEFHKNGMVILEDAVPLLALDHVRERMLEDILKVLALPSVHYNHGVGSGNISQTPPLLADYLHEEVWANRIAVSMMSYIVGPRPQLCFATANTALPGGQSRQAVHSDYYCRHLDFPVFLEVNIFLDDTSLHNGSTEVWLGTHNGYNKKDHLFADMGWIKREVFVERARNCLPVQLTIPKGSIVVRDIRMWHAGMPNYSETPRIMLGFIYAPTWFKSGMRMKFPLEARSRVESWDHIECANIAEFVDDDFNYLDYRQQLNLAHGQSGGGEEEYAPKHGRIAAEPEHYWSAVCDVKGS